MLAITLADKIFYVKYGGVYQLNDDWNSHLPFRRRERAMQLFKTAATLQKFVSYHSQIYNHFNHERHLETRQDLQT